jgi:hypothetical protein
MRTAAFCCVAIFSYRRGYDALYGHTGWSRPPMSRRSLGNKKSPKPQKSFLR